MSELPPLIAQIKAQLGARVPKVNYDLEFEIDGEGMFTVAVKNGEAVVRRGGSADPLVAMHFSPATWNDALASFIRPRLAEIATRGIAGDDPLGAALATQLAGQKPASPEQVIAALRALPLRVVLELEPRGAHRFSLATAGAEEDDPTVTISLAEADLRAMLDGTLAAREAFKAGRLRMKGAATTLMALLSRLLPGGA